MLEPIIEVERVTKQVRDSTGVLTILHEIDFELRAKESAAIVGASAPVWSTSRKSGTVPRTGGGGTGVGSADRSTGTAITIARKAVQSQG